MPSIIVPPGLPWNWMTQRTQHLMRNLSKLGYSVFYEENENTKGEYQEICGLKKISPNLFLCQGVDQLEFTLPSPRLLWITFPNQVRIIPTYNPDFIIYDAADLPEGEFKHWSTYIPLLLKKANLVFASSQLIYEKLAPLHNHIYQVKNGVDYSHFAKPTKVPSELSNYDGEFLVGYSGAIAPWLDWDLLDELSTYFKHINFLYIGALVALRRFPLHKKNVTYLGLKPYESLPSYIQRFDVGLIPFKLTDMTKGCNPIKIYEYCAAGIRVLSSYLPEVKEIPGINIAQDTKTFIFQLNEILQNPNQDKPLRQNFARVNEWSERAAQVNFYLKVLTGENK